MRYLLILLMIQLAACSDEVTQRYATVAAAREDHLFGRGWLPDILPASATNIRVKSNLDINTAEGEFTLGAPEQRTFVKQLSANLTIAGDDRGYGAWARMMKLKGYTLGTYSINKSIWIFACHDGQQECQFRMPY